MHLEIRRKNKKQAYRMRERKVDKQNYVDTYIHIHTHTQQIAQRKQTHTHSFMKMKTATIRDEIIS